MVYTSRLNKQINKTKDLIFKILLFYIFPYLFLFLFFKNQVWLGVDFRSEVLFRKLNFLISILYKKKRLK